MAQSNSTSASHKDDWIWDPTYLASLRELWFILAFFAMVLSYTIGVSFYLGYPADKEAPIALIGGVPQWFLIGVAAPWGLATILSVCFALLYMTDHGAIHDIAPDDASAEKLPSDQVSGASS